VESVHAPTIGHAFSAPAGRSLPATVRRTARRAATWRPKRAGDQTIDIAALVSPFRYDVVVRASLFDAIAARPAGARDDGFVDTLLEHPYAVWFREVELRRFFPWVLADEAAVVAAYRNRVQRAVRTFESFESRGYDPEQPIIVRVARRPRPSDSGVLAAKVRHLGDGGHRLALLLRTTGRLEPHMYRLDPRPAPVIDNTAILVPALGVGERDYARFLSRAFFAEPVDAVDSLRDRVGSECPDRRDELEALVRAHRFGGGAS
jgi:hypothetical protein